MSWQIVKIGIFLKERTGRFKSAQANEMGLKRIEKIDFSGTYHLVEKTTNTDMILVKKGDLLISGINAEKGAITVYEDKEDALATIHYSSYEFDKKKIDIEYFKWFLISDTFKDLLKASSGNGIKTELKAKHLLPLEIYLPNKDCQIEIVKNIKLKHKRVSEIQVLLKSQQNYLHQLRQAFLQEAVQGMLSKQDPKDEPASKLLQRIKAEKQKLIAAGKLKKEKDLPPITEHEIPFELPKGWAWCRLGEICVKIGSGSTPRGGREVYKSEGIKFIRSQNVYNEGLFFDRVAFIDEATHKKMNGTKVLPNDILLNITGGSIGRCALVSSSFDEANVSQHVTIVRTVSLVNKEFTHKLFLSPYFQDYIMATQTGGNREGLAKKNMELMLIPLPPLSEQRRIVSKVEQLMQQLQQLEQQVEQSQLQAGQLLQAVLKEAFNPTSGASKKESKKGKQYKMNDKLTLAAEE